MELVAFLTIWVLFGSALIFSAIGMPRIYYRATISLAGAELVEHAAREVRCMGLFHFGDAC